MILLLGGGWYSLTVSFQFLLQQDFKIFIFFYNENMRSIEFVIR